jgi:cation:H+ antiporter
VLIPILLVCAGFAALYQGGNALLAGSSGLARHFGLPPLLVGLTVVAFATSAPELAVSVLAAFQGTPDIAVGNVLGSNIFNTLIAVGVVAVLAPFAIPKTLMRREIPLGIAATVLVGIFAWTDGGLTRVEGAVLVLALVGVLTWIVRSAMKERALASDPVASQGEEGPEADLDAVPAMLVMGAGAGAALLDMASLSLLDFAVPGAAFLTLLNARFHVKRPTLLIRGLAILFGLAMLVLGSNALVDGAGEIALSFGVSEAMVGLTVVAIGTSAPELATAVAAARKGETELALGNALGSNLFNLLGVLGVAAAIFPIEIAPSFLHRDLLVALGVSILLLLPLMTRNRVGRAGGVAMLALWVAYNAGIIWLELG